MWNFFKKVLAAMPKSDMDILTWVKSEVDKREVETGAWAILEAEKIEARGKMIEQAIQKRVAEIRRGQTPKVKE